MNEFQSIFIQQDFSIDNIDKIKELLNEESNLNWEDRYWSSVILYEVFGPSGSDDDLIQENLENALSAGLTYAKNPDWYLKANEILARMNFKYGRYKHAENSLVMLRDLNPENIPAWVLQYSAINCLKIDYLDTLEDPSLFFDYLKLYKSSPEFSSQSYSSIVRLFLQKIDNASIKIEDREIDIELIFPRLSPYAELAPDFDEYIDDFLKFLSLADSNGLFSQLNEYNRGEASSLLGHKHLLKRMQKHIDQLAELEAKLGELEEEKKNLECELFEFKSRNITVASPLNLNTTEIIDNNYVVTSRKTKILIFGDSTIEKKHILGIATSLGLDKEQIDLELDYQKNKRIDINKYRYHSPYGAIMIGPNAHKIAGLEEYSSLIEKMKREEGFPHIEEIKTYSGELKITKQSLKDALSRSIVHLKSIGLL